MAVPFSNTKLRVPQGFQCLLEGVAREVLQMQPNDIFAFSAVYFENLLQLRESGVVDPVADMARTQDRMYNNKAFQKPDVDVNNDEQQGAAVKIQTKYRQHQSKGVVDQMRQDKAATKIQAGIRGHLGRKRVANLRKEMSGSSHRSSNAKDENDLEELAQEDEFNINEEDEETARTQGSIDTEMTKGVEPEEMTILKSPVNDEQDVNIDHTDPGVQSAATKIQAGFRGMQTRQHLLKPRQNEESKDNVEEDLTAREDGEGSTAFEELDNVEASEAERRETPNAKLVMSGGGMEEDIKQEDEAVEMEFSEDDPEMIKAIEEIQDSFRKLKAEDENDDELVENNKQENLEMESAATKIQAGFKGMKLRKELKEKKLEKEIINDKPEMVENNEQESLEMESAATKIQAGFKGMKLRKELKEKKLEKKIINDEPDMVENNEQESLEMESAATKIQAGFKGMKLRKELKEKNLEKKIINDEPEMIENNEQESLEMESAATKIQAGFKGMKLRKELKEKKLERKVINDEPKEIQPEEANAGNLTTEEDSDAELVVAANKIQAGFRGYKTRKEVQRLRNEKGEELVPHEETKEDFEAEENVNNYEDDEKRVVAASKIQAGFKGYKTRREVEVIRKQKALVSEEDDEKRVVAASKIQAGFKGYKTRREVEVMRSQKAQANGEKEKEEGHKEHVEDDR